VGPSEAVGLLVEITGRPYRLVGRLPGGETGAHAVRDDATGETFVVKWEQDGQSQVLRREAVDFTRRLRDAAGWPVPDQRTVEGAGTLFVLQELLPGDPIRQLTHSLTDSILERVWLSWGDGPDGVCPGQRHGPVLIAA
jgi:hypothetical protein